MKRNIIIFIVILLCLVLFSILYSALNNHIREGFGEKYTAIIVEPREHPALEFVLNNFYNNLSDDWQFIIFHGNKNITYVQDIMQRVFKDKTRVSMVNLNIDNLTIDQYNKLFYTKQFYDKIPTETFLVFQTDTMIFKENSHKLEEFVDYDYIGAPFVESEWNKNTDKIGNGGLSIRKKSKMLELLDKCDIQTGTPEDVFFGGLFCDKVDLHKPSYEKSKEFSVEQVYYKNPIGVHKPWNFAHNRLLKNMYPELDILESLNKK